METYLVRRNLLVNLEQSKQVLIIQFVTLPMIEEDVV